MTRKEERTESAVKKGYEAFKNSFNCAQSTFAGLMREFRPDDPAMDTLMSAIYPFAAGGGRGDTCGGVNGALMFLGVLYYKDDTQTPYGFCKQPAISKPVRGYGIATEYVDRYVAKWGSVMCREVHPQLMGRQYDLADPVDGGKFYMDGAGDKCQEVVEFAIRTVCDMILDDDGNVREL